MSTRKFREQRHNGIERARELLNISGTRPLTEEEIRELKGSHTGSGGIYSTNLSQFFTIHMEGASSIGLGDLRLAIIEAVSA